MPCAVCGGEKVYALGLCNKHYKKHNRYGDANFRRVYTVRPLEDRFFEKIEKLAGCWIWTGGKSAAGYGQIQEGKKGSPQLLAHRVSYTIHKGPIPDGLNVLHSCDNPSCVNPDHLRAGTASENTQEAYDKGRKVSPFIHKKNRRQGPGAGHPGSKNPNAKLTEDDIRAVRASGKRPTEIAREYNITVASASQILLMKSWKHVI